MEGEAGYDAGGVAYSTTLVRDDPAVMFIPPDLYLRFADDSWYVLSPWDQGVPRDELPEFGPDELTLDYAWVTGRLSEIERLDDEVIDDEDYLHYAGSIVGEPSSENADGNATDDAAVGLRPFGIIAPALDVELWLDRENYLPRKMRLRGETGEAGTRPSRIRATFEFFEYDEPVAVPEPPGDARPFRDLQLAVETCVGPRLADCAQPQDLLRSIASDSCEGTGKRICVVPFGQISPGLVEHLVDYYQSQYGLSITVLTPTAVPEWLVNPQRDQVGAEGLITHMSALFPDAYADPNAILMGLTPIDFYHESSHFRYVFGLKGRSPSPFAVISTFRMDPETYGEFPDDALLFSRTRKLFSKYVGLLYYQLPTSSDPASPMYNSILGPGDLDRMEEPLPVAAAP